MDINQYVKYKCNLCGKTVSKLPFRSSVAFASMQYILKLIHVILLRIASHIEKLQKWLEPLGYQIVLKKRKSEGKK